MTCSNSIVGSVNDQHTIVLITIIKHIKSKQNSLLRSELFKLFHLSTSKFKLLIYGVYSIIPIHASVFILFMSVVMEVLIKVGVYWRVVFNYWYCDVY